MTKNDQKGLKIKLSAHDWGGLSCGRRRRRLLFLGTPQTCLNAGFAGPLRLQPADAGHYKPAASGGFAGIKKSVGLFFD